MNFIVSQKQNENALLLVVTDTDILGKKFEEGKVQLDLTKKFYQGEEKNKEEVEKLIKEAKYIHLTGKEAVAIGVEMKLVDNEKILYVQGVPHAEVLVEL